jgi:hypothetical protein
MKIVAASDLHGYLPDVPPCDLLLLAGDLCPVENHGLGFQRDWLAGPFARWLAAVPARHTVGIAGNHDFLFEEAPDLVPAGLKWTYLCDQQTTVDGLTVYGTPWQPTFGDWAFNLDEDDLATKWALIPPATDILLLHGPPFGIGDRVVRGVHTGSPSLTAAIERLQPPLVICGHIHEGRGSYRLGRSLILNVAVVNEHYAPAHVPVVVDWDAVVRTVAH